METKKSCRHEIKTMEYHQFQARFAFRVCFFICSQSEIDKSCPFVFLCLQNFSALPLKVVGGSSSSASA